jgi:NTE family protein
LVLNLPYIRILVIQPAKMPKQNIEARAFIRILRTGVILLSAFILHNPEVPAQESGDRPHIGLALSGGGALGIAHLGVLKVMEESGLRPDFIAGVSMGSIIGGMYSIGYSADSILNLLHSIDLNGAISNKIPENKIIFFEKRHFQNSITSLPVSFKKARLPSGLSNGQVVENFLSFYAWPAADINDFSRLPIPFTCVGVDILTDRWIDLKKGYLPDAIRASIAIPSVFTPIKIDSALLLDGGILRNFPAQEVIDMGADIVIGSYTGFKRRDEKELQSLSDIVKQITMARSYNDFEQQKKLVRYLVVPDLKGLPSYDFSKVDSIYQRGYKAALPFKNKFTRLADSLNKFGFQKPPANILNKEFYTFYRIEINGNSNYSDRQILGVLDIAQGEQVNKYMLKEKIEMLYGKAWFDKIKYRIEPRNDSLLLNIECTERPKAMFYGALHYDDATGAGALLAFSVKNLLIPGSVFNLDSYVGQYYRVRALLLKYIDWKQKYSLAAEFHSENTRIPVLHLKNETGDVISRNFTAGLIIARRIGMNHNFNISGEFENLNLLPRYVSSSGLNNISYNYFTTSLQYRINTLNTKHFPDRGTILNISGSSSKLLSGIINTDVKKTAYDIKNPGDFLFDRFYVMNGNFRQYISAGKRVTFSIHTDAVYVSKCDSAISRNNFYLLGGIQTLSERSVPMTGYHSFEIPVKKAAGGGIEFDIEVFKDLHISLKSDLFAVQDIYREKGFSLMTGFGAGAGYMSVIGPVRIGIMYAKDTEEDYFKRVKGYISIGYNF